MKKLYLLSFVFLFGACYQKTVPLATPARSLVADGKLWSAAFMQTAAEYNALCHQAYNIARLRINEALSAHPDQKLAIVTDIDETFLDNSYYAVQRALQNKDYDTRSWYEWTAKGSATPLPGSLDFFNDAASKGVTVFYVTNRDEAERPGTLNNLKKYGYPYADNEHLILRTTTSSKETRRENIAKHYNIVMLLGDNLSDFSALWDKKTVTERANNVETMREEFGKKFIVLPNPNYGGWEDAIYGNSHSLTPAQKDSAIKSVLKPF